MDGPKHGMVWIAWALFCANEKKRSQSTRRKSTPQRQTKNRVLRKSRLVRAARPGSQEKSTHRWGCEKKVVRVWRIEKRRHHEPSHKECGLPLRLRRGALPERRWPWLSSTKPPLGNQRTTAPHLRQHAVTASAL